jgi:hypothetical protein
MTPRQEALAVFRRGSHDVSAEPPLPAVFVLEPGMFIAASVTASWHPVCSLQALSVTERSGVAIARPTLEHAIERLGARTVVVCGEGRTRPDRGGDRERLLGACTALAEDSALGPLLRASGVAVEAMYFDTSEGDLYRWDAAARRFVLLADRGLDGFFSEVRGRAASGSAARAVGA